MIDTTSLNAGLEILIRVSVVVFVSLFASIAPCKAMPCYVDVTLGASQKPVSEIFVFGPLQICGKTTITLNDGRYLLQLRGNALRLLASTGDKQQKRVYCVAPKMEFRGLRNSYLKIERGRSIRAYAGTVIVSISRANDSDNLLVSHLMLVNHVGKADYVAGVCAAELPKGARLEAVKAQAVLVNCMLARTGALAVLNDTTQNAAYMGVATDRPDVRLAAQTVGDATLCFAEKPIHPYFHSTCAGRTSRACDIFQLDRRSYPYLQSVECHFCQKSPFWKHTVSVIPWPQYAAVFGDCLPAVSKKDEAGRPIEVSLCTAGSVSNTRNLDRTIQPAYDFWMKIGQKFGWNVAPGNLFSFQRKGNYLEIESRGGGHGVGLCQWGAMGMAEQGKKYDEILRHYFPLAKLSK
ncbi:MAG: SpoIID/LytB domain-containing protein [Candidatus Obscuribacterales bacterium]|nr:SpoIID/LytB domain-containing protein [Candidatus Obscuribacterales bacterium]